MRRTSQSLALPSSSPPARPPAHTHTRTRAQTHAPHSRSTLAHVRRRCGTRRIRACPLSTACAAPLRRSGSALAGCVCPSGRPAAALHPTDRPTLPTQASPSQAWGSTGSGRRAHSRRHRWPWDGRASAGSGCASGHSARAMQPLRQPAARDARRGKSGKAARRVAYGGGLWACPWPGLSRYLSGSRPCGVVHAATDRGAAA